MKYKFYDTVVETTEELEDAVVSYAARTYDELLDSSFGMVNVCGYEYRASEVLKNTDPITYRCGFGEYVSDLYVEVEDLDNIENFEEEEYEI